MGRKVDFQFPYFCIVMNLEPARGGRLMASEGCELEARSVTLTVKNRPMISENRVLRVIFDLRGRKWKEGG
jgi:hypothetical protein